MTTNPPAPIDPLSELVEAADCTIIARDGAAIAFRTAAGEKVFVASFERPILRLTALDILSCDEDSNALCRWLAWSGEWIAGRVFFDPRRRQWAASTGVFVRDDLCANHLKFGLRTLIAGLRAARLGAKAPEPAWDRAPDNAMQTIADPIDRLGIGYDRSDGGDFLSIKIAECDGVSALRVSMSLLEGRWLVAKVWCEPRRSLPSTGQTYHALNQAQGAIPFGVVGYIASRGEPVIVLPIAWSDVDNRPDTLLFLLYYARSVVAMLPL